MSGSTARQGPAKVSIMVWHGWRDAIDQLRFTHSWRRLSTLHGYSERGWAQAAYNHRSILSPADAQFGIDLARKLGRPQEAHQEETVSTSPQEPETFAAMARRVDELGYPEADAATYVGFRSLTGYRNVAQGRTNTTAKKLEKMAQLLEVLGAGEVPVVAPPPPPPSKPRPPADPYTFVDEVREGLLELAQKVSAAGAHVPEAFRSEYNDRRDELLSLAAKYDR